MIKTLQIIALFQGLFVLVVLFANRKEYKKMTFRLIFGALITVLLYIVGDDDNNLFFEGVDLFLFDSSLFITFLFLFFRYYNNGKESFAKLDYLFFIPNLIYFIIELIEINSQSENFIVEIIEVLIEFTFFAYLCILFYSIITTKRKHWILYFVTPISILFGFASINDFLLAFGYDAFEIFNDQNFNTYLLLIIAFLFYFISLTLMNKKMNDILPKIKKDKYNNSNLNQEAIAQYKTDLINSMVNDKMYLNPKLSIHDLSKRNNIPRQYISEVLNEYMNTSFQDFVNEYRVEEFINRLKNNQDNQFTLLAIALDVGFNSKSSFNAIFKKSKGLTPTEYNKTILKNNK